MPPPPPPAIILCSLRNPALDVGPGKFDLSVGGAALEQDFDGFGGVFEGRV